VFYFSKDCFQGWIGEGVTSDVLAQVKPTRAGSSIGVVVAYGVNDAAQKAEEIISEVQNTFYYTSGIIQAKHSNNFET
jgi:hypothetical protein